MSKKVKIKKIWVGSFSGVGKDANQLIFEVAL